MSHWTRLSAISLSAFLSAGSALADITAAEVWADWQDYMNSYGLDTTVGTASESGGTLTVTDFVASMELPEGEITQTIPEMVFAEQGDGTVLITMSPEYPLQISGTNEDGAEMDMTINIKSTDLQVVASGDVNKTNYDFDATGMAISLASMTEDGEAIPASVDMLINGITGNYVATGQDPRRLEQLFTASEALLEVSFEDGEDDFAMTMTMADLKSTADGTLFNMVGGAIMSDALRDGASMAGAFTHGPVQYALAGTDKGKEIAISGEASKGNLNFGISADGLTYGGASLDTVIRASGSDIPFPEVQLNMAESNFNLTMPLLETEEGTQDDFQFALGMTDFTISDQIWGIFDPFGKLPRDPATISLDLTGKASMFFDLVDAEKAEEMGMEQPGALHALTVNQVVVSAVGALLTGEGDFTFNNDDLETFDGMPAPTGFVDMELTGGNKLIDTLVEMGLLPEEQAMGARMMLGLFARPGDGPDKLVSKIEVKGDGSISANGQRIR